MCSLKIYIPRPSWNFTLGVKNEMGERQKVHWNDFLFHLESLPCLIILGCQYLKVRHWKVDCVWVVCQQIDFLSLESVTWPFLGECPDVSIWISFLRNHMVSSENNLLIDSVCGCGRVLEGREYPLDPDLMRPRWGGRGGIPAAMDIDFHIIPLFDAIHPNLHLCLSLTLRLCFNLLRKKNFPK